MSNNLYNYLNYSLIVIHLIDLIQYCYVLVLSNHDEHKFDSDYLLTVHF